VLGYNPEIEIEKGIRNYLDWFTEYNRQFWNLESDRGLI
jgi:nucleoside-diphosphate-sugar epimerase